MSISVAVGSGWPSWKLRLLFDCNSFILFKCLEPLAKQCLSYTTTPMTSFSTYAVSKHAILMHQNPRLRCLAEDAFPANQVYRSTIQA